jgi:hypothetical protein
VLGHSKRVVTIARASRSADGRGGDATGVEIKLVRVGLLGFGTVGAAFAELLLERRAAIEDVAGISLELVRVAVRNPGKPRTTNLDAALFTGDAVPTMPARSRSVDIEKGPCGINDPMSAHRGTVDGTSAPSNQSSGGSMRRGDQT